MARPVSLKKLRGLARLYADQRPGPDAGSSDAENFVEDSNADAAVGTLNDLINLALTELYDLLVAARGQGQYEITQTLSLVPGQALYGLPSNFYQLLTLVLPWGATDTELVRPLAHRERVAYRNWSTWAPHAPKAVRIKSLQGGGSASLLEIIPTPTTAIDAEIRFIPSFSDLTSDDQTFDGVNGWEKLVALRAAYELTVIEKDPSRELLDLYERERRRIEELAAEREAAHPKEVLDVYPEVQQIWPFVRRPEA